MAGTILRTRIRFAVDAILGRQLPAVTDKLTSLPLRLWQAEDVQFEIGIFNNGVIAADVSNLATVTLQLKGYENLEGAPIFTKSAAPAAIAGANWTDDTQQNVLLTATLLETAIELDGAKERPLELTVFATTTDGTPRRIPLCQTLITLMDSGYGDIGTLVIVSPGARMRNNKLQVKNQTDGLYYDFVLRTNGGVIEDSIEGAGEA